MIYRCERSFVILKDNNGNLVSRSMDRVPCLGEHVTIDNVDKVVLRIVWDLEGHATLLLA